MPSVHEHDVADDEQTPLIAKHFDHSVHNALCPVIFAHAASTAAGCYLHRLYNCLRVRTSCVCGLKSSGLPPTSSFFRGRRRQGPEGIGLLVGSLLSGWQSSRRQTSRNIQPVVIYNRLHKATSLLFLIESVRLKSGFL